MYSFRKSKKGFTLIELMVVVAIIGVLALLGLRVYIGQQQKAKNAIVIANASTVHTLIQGDLLDHDYPSQASAVHVTTGVIPNIGGNSNPATTLANMKNPFKSDGNIAVNYAANSHAGLEGEVTVVWVSPNNFTIQGIGAEDVTTGEVLTATQ